MADNKTHRPRFGVYFVPGADTALYRFGAAVLGYNCYTGAEVSAPAGDGVVPPDWAEITREPRTYGFHATLKAPFYLAAGFAEADLVAELSRLANASRAVPRFVLEVRALGSFVALVGTGSCPALDQLAANCVRGFDRFRAPLTAHERLKRLASGPSERQIANLDTWGYPYVLDDYRFHMTLTGPLAPARQPEIVDLLQDKLRDALGDRPVPVDRLTLVRQDHQAMRFRVMAQAMLG